MKSTYQRWRQGVSSRRMEIPNPMDRIAVAANVSPTTIKNIARAIVESGVLDKR